MDESTWLVRTAQRAIHGRPVQMMDADGDGKLSLQEFQAAHERIFKAMDANKDGFVTLEEMQNFIRGTSSTGSPAVALHREYSPTHTDARIFS